jgi:hypothetical protein
MLLVTDFINLNIKPVQSFKDDYKDMMCVYIYRINTLMYIRIYVYTMFLQTKIV